MRLTLAALLLTTACATVPPPLCDREAQEWNKFDTQEDQCAATWVPQPETPNHDAKRPRKPADPDGDDSDDTGSGDDGHEEPDDGPDDSSGDNDDATGGKPPRVKGNNGWGNGDQDPPGNSGPNNNAENWEW